MGNTPSDSSASSSGDMWDIWEKDDEEDALALARDAAGGHDTTGMSVTGADGVTGTAAGADPDATGATGVSRGTVDKHNWAAANTKASSGGKDATAGRDETTGTGNVGKDDTTGAKGETTGGSGVCVAGRTGEYAGAVIPEITSYTKRQYGFTPAQLGKKRDQTGVTTECNAGPEPESRPKPAPVIRDENVESDEPVLDQCGLDPDPEGRWVPATFDPRIKNSRLKPEEKAKCQAIIDKIFHPDAILGKRVDFPPREVIEIMDLIIPYLESEPMLIEDVPLDIVIVADLHGQLYDLDRVFKDDAKDGKPAWECQKYLFLGDYVDRGRQSLEIVMALYCIKMLYPDRIFLLRGNHEFVQVNATNGFILDFYDRYCEATCDMLYWKVNESFCYLSISAIVGNKIFCSHAGISPQAFTRRQMLAVRKPIIDSREDVLLHDQVWADIAKGLRGTTFNGKRAASIYFGLDELAFALDNIDCIGLFRGHSIMPDGFDFIGGICVSLFTATGCKNMNTGAVAHLDKEGKLSFRIYVASAERVAFVNMLKRLDGARDDDGDDETTVDDNGEGIPTMSQ